MMKWEVEGIRCNAVWKSRFRGGGGRDGRGTVVSKIVGIFFFFLRAAGRERREGGDEK